MIDYLSQENYLYYWLTGKKNIENPKFFMLLYPKLLDFITSIYIMDIENRNLTKNKDTVKVYFHEIFESGLLWDIIKSNQENLENQKEIWATKFLRVKELLVFYFEAYYFNQDKKEMYDILYKELITIINNDKKRGR